MATSTAVVIPGFWQRRMLRASLLVLALLLGGLQARAEQASPVKETAARVLERMRAEVPVDQLPAFTAAQAIAFLTEDERDILGRQHITFTVNVPVRVSVMRDSRMANELFWLEREGYKRTSLLVRTTEAEFEVFQKEFPAGPVGLGITSVSGAGEHYLVSLKGLEDSVALELTSIHPERHTLGQVEDGERVYLGRRDRLIEPPAELEGEVLLRTDRDTRKDGLIINVFRVTQYPATETPDQIVLTWSDDPRTTQAIQWRTSTAVKDGAVRYVKKPAAGAPAAADWKTVPAKTFVLENTILVNDPLVHRHTVTLEGLEPGTPYLYTVKAGKGKDSWLDPMEFQTAPGEAEPFRFIYLGDPQMGFDVTGDLMDDAIAPDRDPAFFLVAGDIVNRGNERDDWDNFFYNTRDIYHRYPLVPVVGNHEYQRDMGEQGPWMYLKMFELPSNGPKTISSELGYAFEYSNALFVVLDGNLDPALQAPWLEEQLRNSDATWKFVAHHQPIYSASPGRDNPQHREFWGRLYDEYHVDIALQGHDHSYLRTFPMRAGKRAETADEGTYYVVSTSGTKFYDQASHPYTAMGFVDVSTYQTIDITGDRLVYTSYDTQGQVRDEFAIEK